MVRLTDEQLQELDRASGTELMVVDPRTSTEYVLVRRAEYEQRLRDADEEADLRRFATLAAQQVFQTLDREETEDGQTW